ncbi:tRNA (adenosine(37)-N6)-dimethylallyltransferase MiaA [Maricaulis sp. CAU 1757]
MTRTVLIAGPTASGKTSLSLALAAELDGEIVNADSMQIYEGLELLTARPSAEERAAAPHHLFGVADPAERWSVGRWARAALALIDDIRGRGRVPILVGGTGLYFSALTRGLAEVPEIGEAARDKARQAAEGDGAALYDAARKRDPDAVAAIAPADRQRLLRVLEVWYETGRTLSDFRTETRPLLEPASWIGLVVEPDREALYARIDRRFDAMMTAGALDEARHFLARGLAADLPAMKALGLPSLAAHLAGEVSLEDAVEDAKRESRRYAKRQLTWFRNQMPDWHRIATLDAGAAQREALEFVTGRGLA